MAHLPLACMRTDAKPFLFTHTHADSEAFLPLFPDTSHICIAVQDTQTPPHLLHPEVYMAMESFVLSLLVVSF